MTKTEQQLLAVLDISEDEQLFFLNNLWQNRKLPKWFNLQPNLNGKLVMSDCNRRHLADLAFRLRDGVNDHGHTRHLIYRHLIKSGKIALLNCGCCHEPWWDWWMDSSQPIHWIIAALLAKEKDNG